MYNQAQYSQKYYIDFEPGSTVFNTKPFQMCNRFDQAMMSILLFNHYDNNQTKFWTPYAEQIARPSRTGSRLTAGSNGEVARSAVKKIHFDLTGEEIIDPVNEVHANGKNSLKDLLVSENINIDDIMKNIIT